VILLVSVTAISLTMLQATINAPRDAFRECTRAAATKARSENVKADDFEAYMRNSCSVQIGSLRSAIQAFNIKNGMGKKAAAALSDSFKLIRKSLRGLADDAEDVSIKKKAKALKQVNALNKKVNTEFQSFNAALLKLRKLDPNKQLQQAFQSDQACQALSS
jgi:hypothetical protein